MKKLLPLILLIIPSISLAQDVFYCEVGQVVERSANGEIISNENYQNDQIGSTFQVDKATGRIEGWYFVNSSPNEDIEIVKNNEGYYVAISKDSSFTAAYLSVTFNSFRDVYLFTYTLSGQYIYTGTCSI